MPARIQLSRRRGWRLPPGARSVAHPSVFANPFRPIRRTPGANADAVARYRDWIAARPDLLERARRDLAGRDLACWCRPELACHADVLLELANGTGG